MFQLPMKQAQRHSFMRPWVLTLNSFMMGIISSSRASFVTSPPRRSILLPTKITGTFQRLAEWYDAKSEADLH